jgi:pimeloyl-ACP methyl ester carboxylesterase
MVDSIRRKLLKTGAVAAAMAAARPALAQQKGDEDSGRFYQRGNVRIRYEETGSGFPLLLIPGGGLNGSTIAGIRGGNPFNTLEAFKGEFRCVYADLRNSAGQSTGPLEIDRPWDSYADDHLGLMDHLGIDRFMVLGFFFAGPFIWNLM